MIPRVPSSSCRQRSMIAAVSSLEGNEGILSPNPYQALSSTSKYPVTNCVFMCKCVDIRGQLDF